MHHPQAIDAKNQSLKREVQELEALLAQQKATEAQLKSVMLGLRVCLQQVAY